MTVGTCTAQRNGHINAGQELSVTSGGDTNIKGAVASGRQVTAEAGGNLNIESLQDTAKFDSKSQSASINQSNIRNDCASVQEQSGIVAGDDGFNIKVKGNTDLKGVVITSSQAAIHNNRNKNSLSTVTLTQSDIKNHSTGQFPRGVRTHHRVAGTSRVEGNCQEGK